MNKEIERPLGTALRPSSGAKPRRVPVTAFAGTLAAAFAVAGGLYIALLPDGFRKAEVPVVAEKPPAPVVTSPQPSPVTASARDDDADEPASDGPSIIRVSPDGGSSPNVIVIRDPSAVGQDLRVAHLPDRALLEQSEIGPLPVRSADGRRAADVYARPWSGTRGARIALVIGGLGLSQTGTQTAIAKLPSEVTLAFAPQGNSIGRWMQAARKEGHEILMQVPLEPFDFPRVNPGRNTLTVDSAGPENTGNLHWVLSRTTNYVGVMNYMGARFSADRAAFAPVMQELGQRGLLYLDDGSSARSLAPELAAQNRVPFAAADAAIDDVRDRASILARLDALEATARAKGSAIGTGSAFDITVDTVAAWVAEVRKRGIEVVPVSALAFDPEKG